MEMIKRVHHGFQEFEDARKKHPTFDVPAIFEKWQYIYSQDDIQFSLVQFTPRMYDKYCWEIYQLKGKSLLDDVERFTSKDEAEAKINTLLEHA